MNCRYIRDVRNTVKGHCHVLNEDENNIIVWVDNTHKNYNGKGKNPKKMKKIANLLWEIWCARNNVIFKNDPFNKLLVIERATNLFSDFALDDANYNSSSYMDWLHKKKKKSTRFICWTPPDEGWFKLNFDGSVKNTKGAVGSIIRDSYGKHIIMQSV